MTFIWTTDYHGRFHILEQEQISWWKQRKQSYRVLLSFKLLFFLMLQSQKYLQVCNSLQCTSSVHFKLAAPQIKSCHIIPIVIPLLPAQEIIRFQMSENESKGVTLLFCQVSNIVGAII